jgi:glycerol kinase
MAYQIRDVIGCMEADSGIALAELKVDGGAAVNNFAMQFQADQLGVRVLRPKVVDTTARGAAFLAGLAVGYWKDKADLLGAFTLDRTFTPSADRATADRLYRGWTRAVERARNWEEH